MAIRTDNFALLDFSQGLLESVSTDQPRDRMPFFGPWKVIKIECGGMRSITAIGASSLELDFVNSRPNSRFGWTRVSLNAVDSFGVFVGSGAFAGAGAAGGLEATTCGLTSGSEMLERSGKLVSTGRTDPRIILVNLVVRTLRHGSSKKAVPLSAIIISAFLGTSSLELIPLKRCAFSEFDSRITH
jgi:hypothetical protein